MFLLYYNTMGGYQLHFILTSQIMIGYYLERVLLIFASSFIVQKNMRSVVKSFVNIINLMSAKILN